MSEFRDIEETDQGGIPVGRLLHAVRRKLSLIFGFVVLATLAAVLVSVAMPNLYEAASVVQIDPRKKTIANLEDVVSELKADAATIESEVEIIRSRAIALKVIDLLDLRNDPELTTPTGFNAVLDAIGLLPAVQTHPEQARQPSSSATRDGLIQNGRPGSNPPTKDALVVAFVDRMKVQRVRSTLLISISFRATDPVKAATIANAVAEVYLNEQLESKKRLTGFATDALEHKLTEMRQKVMNTEREVERFKAKHRIFDSEGQILSEKQLARLMEQTVIARNETAKARSKFEQAQRMKRDGIDRNTISEVLDSHTVRLMREKLAEASRKRAELATKYGPRHPEMLKIQAEVRDARREVDQEIERLVDRLENEYNEARTREEELRANLRDRKDGESDTKRRSVELKELQRDANTSRQIFEALLARYKQTAETQDLQLPDARIVETADIPLKPSSPKRRTIVLIGFAAALGLGLAFVIIQEFAIPGIGRPEDVETLLELPHLSSLPILEKNAPGIHGDLHNARLTIAEPGHDFVEAIRHARRELDLSARSEHGRVSLICAALPGEGTSLIASNVAHHYALTGQRVLLIDADLRRANLSRQLAPERTYGLSSVLAGQCPPEAAVLHDKSTNLCFMPATPSRHIEPFNPESLASPMLPATLDRLRGFFDVIIMDTPPILPVIDTQFLADSADQLVFVMTWRRTPKVLAKKAIKALDENREKIVGVIVNQVDSQVMDNQLRLTSNLETA